MLIIAAMLVSLMPGTDLDLARVGPAPTSSDSAPRSSPQAVIADSYGIGSDSLVSNVIENGDMESWYTDETPKVWGAGGGAYTRLNASYSDDYHSGSYSCYLAAQCTPQFWTSAYVQQAHYDNPLPFLSQGIQVSNWWNAMDAPDPLPVLGFYLHVRVYTDSASYNMYYGLLLGDVTGYDNNTYNAYFMLNCSMGVWSMLSRNVTADFESVFRPVQGNDRVDRTNWDVESYYAAESPTEVLLDSCSLTNGTGYEFIENGDFESDTDYWSHTGNMDPSSIAPSSDRQTGSYSANMTASSGQTSYTYVQVSRYIGWPNGYFPLIPGTGKVEFWYNYNDTWDGGSNQYAYACFQFQNLTQAYSVYIFLGQYQDGPISSNYSSTTYIRAPGYGVRSIWHHVSVDLGALFADMGASTGALYQISFYCGAGYGVGSKTVLLLDDVRYYDYPTGDPGFEQGWIDDINYPNYVLPAYYSTAYPVVNRTDDAFAGNHAAKVAVASGSAYATIDRGTYVPFSQDLFFSLQWKMDSRGTYPSAYYSLAYLVFDHGSRYIRYALAYGNTGFGNSSTNVQYLVSDFNQTGSWYHLLRNVTEDYSNAFGDANWNLTEVYFESYCDSADPHVILFDNVGFVDGTPPDIDSTQLVTTTPVYYEPVIVQTHAVDALPGVGQVLVYYSTGGAPSSVVATHIGGGVYRASIPAQSWDADVEWYVYAEDACGTWRTDDNNGAMYQYTVGDDIEPDVEVLAPTPSSTVTGDVDVSVGASDIGSGIERVELSVDSVVMNVDYTPPYALVWNSRAVGNGSQTLVCTAFDNAGNSHSDSVTVDVQNDVAGPVLSGVELNPSAPEYDDNVFVIVAGTDGTAVKNVTLSYRFGTGEWQRMLMGKSASLYAAYIPMAAWNTQVSYYVEAFDIFDQVTAIGSESEPLSYSVGDSVAPTIGVAGPPPTGNLSGVIDFSVTAVDVGSGVGSVTMYVDGVLDSTLPEGAFIAHWDTTTVTDGEHVVLFVVEDNAGNTAAVSFTYQVRNPVGFEAIANTFSQIMSSYGFFIGIGVMALVFGLGKTIMSRRTGAAAAAPKTAGK